MNNRINYEGSSALYKFDSPIMNSAAPTTPPTNGFSLFVSTGLPLCRYEIRLTSFEFYRGKKSGLP